VKFSALTAKAQKY